MIQAAPAMALVCLRSLNSMAEVYDVVVVGLGVMGCGALHALARRGVKVLGLEQFSLPHSQGSSHGHGRICRIAYPELQYSQMALAAWKLWEKYQKEADVEVIIPTGGIDFGPRKTLQPIVVSLTAVGVEHEVIDSAEVTRRYPGVKVPARFSAVYTPQAGIILASKSLEMLRFLAMSKGARVQDSTEVVEIRETEGEVRLTTDGRRGIRHIRAKKVILTPGAWLADIMQKHFSITIYTQVLQMGYLYFKAKDGSDVYDHRKMPVFIEYGKDGPLHEDSHIYGTPAFEYPGLIKAGVHGECPQECGHIITTETRCFKYNKGLEKLVLDGVADFLPMADPEPVLSETCLYTVTKESHFILDHVPGSSRIVVGGGGSGHAFKHGTILGEILADLALKGSTEWTNEVYRFPYHIVTNSRL